MPQGNQLSALKVGCHMGHPGCCRVIIEHAADINAAGAGGDTALHCTALGGKSEIVQLLCLKGAAADTLNVLGLSSQYVAAAMGRRATTQALFAGGAGDSLRCHRGMSVLDGAAEGISRG